MGITAVAPTQFFVYRIVLLAGINQWVALIHQLKTSNTLPSLQPRFLQQTSSHASGSMCKIIYVWFCFTLIHVIA